MWVADETYSRPVLVPVKAVTRVVEADYGQRQDPVGPGNPHGEHAHDVWEVNMGVRPLFLQAYIERMRNMHACAQT